MPEAKSDGSIEVLVGDATEVDTDSTDAAATAETDAAGEEPVEAPPAKGDDDEESDGAWSDAVARLGGAAPDRSGAEGQPERRRLGFLRRGGRGGS